MASVSQALVMPSLQTQAAPEAPAPSRRRLLLASLALATLLPLGLLAGLAIFETMRTYRAAAELRQTDTAEAAAAAFDAKLTSFATALTALSHSPRLDQGGDPDGFLLWARGAADAMGGWITLLGPPPAFEPVGSTRARPGSWQRATYPVDATRVLERAYLDIQRTKAPVVTDLFTLPMLARPMLAVIVPVQRQGELIGALAFGFEPSLLNRVLRWEGRPTDYYAALIDSRNAILMTTRGADGVPIGTAAPAWMPGEMAGRQNGLMSGISATNQPTTFAFHRLAGTAGWVVVVAQTQASQRGELASLFGWIVAAVVAAAAGVGTLVWAWRQQVVSAARQEAVALRTGRDQVRRLLDGMPAMLFLRELFPDGTSRVIQRDGDIATVTGWRDEELRQKQSWDQFHPPGSSNGEFFRAVLREGSGRKEWQMRQPDGSLRWMRVHAHRLRLRPDGSGIIVGLMLNVDAEVTATARAVAAGRMAALGELAAGIAHEMKQPLQTISLMAENAELAATHGDTARTARYLGNIVAQTERAADIIENLRRFARGAPEGVRAAPVSLRRVVEHTLALADAALKRAEIKTEVALDDPAALVMGHEIGLEQVLLNLVLNARDAMAALPPGAPRRIRLKAVSVPALGVVRLMVADTGGGIDASVMDRLFEPFVTTKGPEKGTGLGLSISHGLVTGMGGTIEVANDDVGAVFTLTLPCAHAARAPAARWA